MMILIILKGHIIQVRKYAFSLFEVIKTLGAVFSSLFWIYLRRTHSHVFPTLSLKIKWE